MKTQPISLLSFHNKVKELAEKAGNKVPLVRVTMVDYGSGLQLEFSCYVNGYDFHSGKTPQEALAKLKLQMFPPKQSISDVVVEVEGENEA